MQGQAICLNCKHTWQAVCPVGCAVMECPSCGSMKGCFNAPVLPKGMPYLECNCGNHLFIARQDEKVQCSHCGIIQDFIY